MKWVPIVAVLIMGLGLGYVVFHKSTVTGPPPELVRTNDSLKAVVKRYDSTDIARDSAIRVYQAESIRKMDSLQSIATARHERLKTAEIALQSLSIKVQDLANLSGDHAMKEAADSLRQALDSSYDMVEALSGAHNALVQNFQDEIGYKDSLYHVLQLEIKDLKFALTSCDLNFDGLKKYSDGQDKKIKRQSLWSKIGLIAAATFGFIAGHGLK